MKKRLKVVASAVPFAIPAPPPYLSPEEKQVWRYLEPALRRQGTCAECDWIALDVLVSAFVIARALGARLRELGWTPDYAGGQEQIWRERPILRVLHAYNAEVLDLLGRFGLTAADFPPHDWRINGRLIPRFGHLLPQPERRP